MVPVGVWYTSGHEVVQQVRPTREPDGTTSGLAFATTPQVVLLSFTYTSLTFFVLDDTCKDVIASPPSLSLSLSLVVCTNRSR